MPNHGTAPWRLRTLAALFDALVVAVPLLIGWLVVYSLRDENGGGTADRAVFGAAAIVVAGALFVWNSGFREGATGQSVGKSMVRLTCRDAASRGPIGHRRSLRRQFALDRRTDNGSQTEIVLELTALADGFMPIPKDTSVPAVRRRRLFGLAALVLGIAGVLVASITIGAQPLTISDIWHAMFDYTGTTSDGIVRSLRVPRTALGLVVGIALGVAGALIQGHTRNPLADAGLLGLNAGAAFLVVIAIHFFGLGVPSQYIWFAFAGSFMASIVVFGAASIGNGNATPLTLALAGAAVAFFLQAMTNAVVLLDRTALEGYRFWIVGEVAGRDLSVLWQVLPFLVAGVVIALAGSPGLNVLSLGDDVAKSLGSNVALSRTFGIIAITLLTGAATAACGPIAFIGLVVPHIARSITGPDYRWLVPYAGLLGGLMLLLADVIGRVVVRPGELQVGIVAALVGAPFFIALVRRRRLVSL